MMMMSLLSSMSHGGKRKLPEIRLILGVPPDLPTNMPEIDDEDTQGCLARGQQLHLKLVLSHLTPTEHLSHQDHQELIS